MKKLHIIILNWKRYDETISCLKSIEKINIDKGIDCEIVIVDNNSKDKSVEHFRNLKSNFKLQIIENKENYGFAGGNNVGLKYAMNMGSDYVIVINNDTRVDPGFAMELIKVAEEDEEIGIVSPKIYFEKNYEFHKDRYKPEDKGKVIWYAGGVIDWNNMYGSNFGVDEVDSGQFDKQRKIAFATGACFLITKKALFKAGFFDERYFLYLEDMELSQRVLKSDLKIIFAPKSVVWHKVSQSSGIGSSLNDYFLTRNRLFFAKTYASSRTNFALFREAIKFLFFGREWQKKGVLDYFKNNLGKGSWKN